MIPSTQSLQSGRRQAVYAGAAMAATSHPAASLAAVEILRAGGNAVDAGVAAALALTIGEPMMCGLGGDMFALYAPPGAGPDGVIAMNGSGRAPSGFDADELSARLAKAGESRIPVTSADAITVPCAVAGLCRLLSDHGRLEFGRVAEPAIALGEEGLPVAPRTAYDWHHGAERLQGPGKRYYLTSDGRPYGLGQRFKAPHVSEILRRVGADGPGAFYEGELAADMVATLRAAGGAHRLEDFASVTPQYVEPISTGYKDLTIFTPPPNGQGAITLLLLEMFGRLPMAGLDPLGAERTHLEAEAVARAYATRNRLLADPDTAEGAVAMSLRDPALAERLAASIDPARATPLAEIESAVSEAAPHKDTVYLCVVDAEGGVLSLIFSIFDKFGSGLASERFGVLFHNRGAGFVVSEGHPNRIAPGKRPLHTLIPSLAFKDDACVMAFGVMGGQYQAAGQARFLANLCEYGMGLQEAIDAPRAFWEKGVLELETGFAPLVAETLASLGHSTRRAPDPIGGAQAIWIDRALGTLIGASEPRKDGCALGY